MTKTAFDVFSARLRDVRDGPGFGPTPGARAEPEPTALATIALDDDDARRWLLDHQRPDGGLAIVAGAVVADAATATAALAMPAGDGRERAIDHLIASRARQVAETDVLEHDPDVRGWGWTSDTFGWVEPTAQAVLALRLLRPGAKEEIDDGIALLADRESVGGGWNYGNPVVLGVAIGPFVQTTAIALLALQGSLPEVSERGMNVLRARWDLERGGLSLGLALAALRLAGSASADEAESALLDDFHRTGFLDDVVALSWATIACGPGLERLRIA